MTSTEISGIPITQTSYYSPVLNAAIFDGPLRLYFSQYHESEALKIYFQIQERIAGWKSVIRNELKDRGVNIFIMLYPDQESFQLCCNGVSDKFAIQAHGVDRVIGVNGSLNTEDYSTLLQSFESLVAPVRPLEAHA